MKITRILLSVLFVGLAAMSVIGQQSEKRGASKTEAEILKFMDEYAEDLRQNRAKETSDRYDRRGAYFLGHGDKSLETFEAIQKRYAERKKGIIGFEWRDITVEVISPKAVVVMARFGITGNSQMQASYTGLFVKTDGKWRIRAEDESFAAPPPPKAKAQ